jgi:hypothetical protein
VLQKQGSFVEPLTFFFVKTFTNSQKSFPYLGLMRKFFFFNFEVRFFVEECDNLQGFHFLADDTDAFGGMAIQFLR